MSKTPSALNRANITLLGPKIDHRDSLSDMLADRVGCLSWIPDYRSFCYERSLHLSSGLGRAVDQIRGTTDPVYLAHLIKSLDESDSRLIIAYWGTIPVGDLRAIKKARPKIKLVLMALCYPLALTSPGITWQNFCMRSASGLLDGILYPSGEMGVYFGERIFGMRRVPSVTLPPCWPDAFQATGDPVPSAQEPNLIYVGRTDLDGGTVHAADDLRPLMREILDAGIDLAHGYSAETDDGHPHRKPFPSLPVPDLIQMMGRFDASLIAYNTEACARDDRFWLTVPDRLITSVAAGVPIAIPKKGYDGAKSYLKNYPAMIEFDSPEDLARTLANRPRIDGLRTAAWRARRSYAAGQQGPLLQDFLEKLL